MKYRYIVVHSTYQIENNEQTRFGIAVVLDEGECVGIGTHKELLKTCDVYKEIALSQLSEEELKDV